MSSVCPRLWGNLDKIQERPLTSQRSQTPIREETNAQTPRASQRLVREPSANTRDTSPQTHFDSFQTESGQTGSSQKCRNFPYWTFIGECGQNDATYGKLWQHVATRAHLEQHMTKRRGFVALLWKPRLSRPRLEACDDPNRRPGPWRRGGSWPPPRRRRLYTHVSYCIYPLMGNSIRSILFPIMFILW